MTILITGATGAVGRLVVDELIASGTSVRALTRDSARAGLPAAVDVATGDLADPSSLPPRLFDDLDAVFVFPLERGVDVLVERSVASGVDRFVVLSSLAVAAEFPRDLRSVSYRHHLAVEDAVMSRTSGWTMLRPGTFANNLLTWAYPITSGSPVRMPYAHSSQAPIHEADVAAVAALTLTTSGHRGKSYAMTGPESLTRIEQLGAIARAIGRTVPIEEITPKQFRADVARFVPEEVIAMLLDYWSDTAETPEIPKSTVSELTGSPGRTLGRWALDHRSAFLASA